METISFTIFVFSQFSWSGKAFFLVIRLTFASTHEMEIRNMIRTHQLINFHIGIICFKNYNIGK